MATFCRHLERGAASLSDANMVPLSVRCFHGHGNEHWINHQNIVSEAPTRGTFGKLVLSSIPGIPPYDWTFSTACMKTQEGELIKNTRLHHGGWILHFLEFNFRSTHAGAPRKWELTGKRSRGVPRYLGAAFCTVENSHSAGRWGETTSQPGGGEDSCSQVIDSP